MTGLVHDVRFTLRNLSRSPGLGLVIILSLALGIGANTAIFSLVRAVMLRSLPVRNPEQLRLLNWHGDTWPKGLNQSSMGGPSEYKESSWSLPFPLFKQLERQTDVFASVFAFAPLGIGRQNTTLFADGATERVDGEMVSGQYFAGLGVSPAIGRLISSDDERGAAQVAVISYPYWMRRFGGDPSVLQRQVTIDRQPFAIIGVAPARFLGVQPGRVPDVWVPMLSVPALAPWGYAPQDTPSLLEARSYWWAQVMARLKDGVNEQQALAKADALFQQFVPDALPQADRSKLPHLGFESGASGLDTLRRAYEQPLTLLMAMVGIVLLIACANIAVLLLARAMARRREFALRLSLGAPRSRLVRQLFTENLMLAGAGGAVGVLCAGWTAQALLLLIPPARRPLLDGGVDLPTLAFAAAVSIATAVLFGLAPTILGTKIDLLPAIKQSGTGAVSSERPAHRLWSTAFVVVQIALSVVLLTGASLLLRTLTNLERAPRGVDDRHLLVFGLDASQNGYSGDRLAAFYDEVIRRLSAMPGARGASALRLRLFSGWVSNSNIRTPGMPEKLLSTSLYHNAVGPDFARTTGLRLVSGRDLTWGDVEGKRRVALVNEEMARRFFGDLNVLGREWSFGTVYDAAHAYQIVGVVSDAMYSDVRRGIVPTAYIPFTTSRGELHGMFFEVNTPGDPLRLAAQAREAVRSLDPSLPVTELDAMVNQVDDSLWQERLFAKLTSAFSALAIALALIGLYGTISYGVGRRRSEIAVRMALGARYSQVLWMILKQAIVFAAIGVAAGTAMSLWTGRYLSSLLFGLTPRDPLALAVAACALTIVALAAGYVPARRAALVDPARALKQE